MIRIIFVFILLMTTGGLSWARSSAQEVSLGNKYFAKGDYRTAHDHYLSALAMDAENPWINYNVGVSSFKLGDESRSGNFFNKALLSDDKHLKANTYYNLGVSNYKIGMKKVDQDIKAALVDLESSKRNFHSTLELKKTDQDAKAWETFIAGEIERLKRLLEEQKQQKSGTQQKPGEQDKEQSSKEPQKSSDKQDQESSQQKARQEDSLSSEGENSSESKNSSHDNSQDLSDQDKNSNGKDDKLNEADKDNKDNKDESLQQQKKSASEAEKDPKSPSSSGHDGEAVILSQEEADNILDNFEQNDQPRGFLNFAPKIGKESPVGKDW